MKSLRDSIIFLIPVLIIAAYYFISDGDKKPAQTAEWTVVDVIDGDTVTINDADNSSVRYLGIDTPEIAYQDSPGDPLSEEAAEFNRQLVRGKNIRLEFDENRYDVYGRLLAHVYVDGERVNEMMLREGLATPLIIEPNLKHAEAMYSAASEARSNKKGLWGDLNTMNFPPGNSMFKIDTAKAHRYEGKRVVISGRITDVRQSDKVTVLKLNDDFEVVIFTGDLENFKYFGIDPANYYNGKLVEVTGRVKMYKGMPGIIVNHPMLIKE